MPGENLEQSKSGTGRLSIGPRLMLRELRADWSVIAWLPLVVLLASLFLAATPRFFNEMSDEGLRHAAREAASIQRNVSVGRLSKIATAGGDDAFANIARAGVRFRQDELPESLDSLITDESFVIESPRFGVSPLPGEPPFAFSAFEGVGGAGGVFMRMRYQQDVGDHVSLVAGTLPESQLPVPIILEEDAEPELLPLYQIAVTEETLNAMEVELGDRFLMKPDRSDRAYRAVTFEALDYFMVLEIAGIIEPSDSEEAYWYEDFALHRPQVYENPDFVLMYPAGLMAPADYGRMLADTGGALWTYSWRYFIDPELMDAGTVDQLAGDLLNLELRFDSVDVALVGDDSVTTGLSLLIGRFRDQRKSSIAMLSLVSIGLLAVSLAVVAVLAALFTVRQTGSTFLLRTRGASRRQLTISRLMAGLLLTAPPAALGYFAATEAVAGRPSTLSVRAAMAVALAATALIVLVALPVIRKDLGALHRGDFVRPASLRRKVGEAAVVAIAVVSIFLLRRRGLDVGDDAAFDPLLAAAPALLAIAFGIVTLRLYVYPVRVLSWLGSRRRDAVAFVGFRRILQQAPAARMPLVVILLAVAVATFAGTIGRSIDEGQQESTWHEVGADYRIAGAAPTTQLSRFLEVTEMESIEQSAFGLRLDSIAREVVGTRDPIEFLGLEAAEYNAVTAGTRADAKLPEAMTQAQVGEGIGTEANPIPSLLSREWADFRSLAPGDTFVLDFGRVEATFVITETRDRFAGLPADRAFVVADSRAIDAVFGVTRPPTVLYLRAPDSAGDEIEAAVKQARGSVLTARTALYDQIHGAPLVAGVGRGFNYTFWLTAALAIMAVVAAFALTSDSRNRDLAYLRTLGLSSREATGVTILEQLPPTLIAASLGSLLGLGMAVLFEPGIDLTAFTGPGLEAGLTVDVGGIVIIIAGLTLAVLTAVGISGYRTRDDNLGGILRLGDE